MNYERIKHLVVEVTHSLKLVPGDAIKDMLGNDWELPGLGVRLDPAYTHPSITCVVHLLGCVQPNLYDGDDTTPCSICTVMVDEVPAFFFIRIDEKAHYGYDVRYDNYILDWDVTREFLHILMGLALKRSPDSSYRLQQALVTEEVPSLTKFYGYDLPWNITL
jgi:hypothetical protein